VQYFTDQGDLSPILSGGQADVLVAEVFTRWTAVPGVAISAIQAGHLAEDVSGANVIGFPDGSYSIPDDIQPGAITTPVGIVYDFDGAVTDALLGAGAGGLAGPPPAAIGAVPATQMCGPTRTARENPISSVLCTSETLPRCSAMTRHVPEFVIESPGLLREVPLDPYDVLLIAGESKTSAM
jgi:hypothetical protein